MIKTAQIIVVGSEFFSRDKRDSNSIWLTEELEKRGVRVLSKSIVADELSTLARVIRQGLDSVDLVISTGGLGPTEDDRTREAAARALGKELVFHPELATLIEERFRRRGREMSDNNRRQAYLPADTVAVLNPNGTAPGFCCEGLLALPGPPREMKGMFLDFLDRKGGEFGGGQMVLVRRTLRVAGLGESDMDDRIADLYKDLDNPEVTINFTPQGLEIHITAKAASPAEGEQLMEPLISAIKERLEGYLYSDDNQELADVVVGMLSRLGLTLAAAESVTGGHLAHRLCSVAGAGQVFQGSVVAYTERLKQVTLGVREETLSQHGVVSEAVAREMSEGARALTGADLTVSCTGFAGPDGGTDEDPVGTVYVGFASPEKITVKRLSIPGDRNLMRARTSQAMLYVLFRYLRTR